MPYQPWGLEATTPDPYCVLASLLKVAYEDVFLVQIGRLLGHL